MTLQIEEGCFYKNRLGEVVGPMIKLSGHSRSFCWHSEYSAMTFNREGRYSEVKIYDCDLIEKVPAPNEQKVSSVIFGACKVGSEPVPVTALVEEVVWEGEAHKIHIYYTGADVDNFEGPYGQEKSLYKYKLVRVHGGV